MANQQSSRPELVQFGSLKAAHFERCPVWVAAHTVDYEAEWYEEIDEETFRPWDGPLPVDPGKGMFLVRSSMTLPDGTVLRGFVTPQRDSDAPALGTLQPHVFLQSGQMIGFWAGILGWSPERKRKTCDLLARESSDLFPMQFAAEDGLSQGRGAGVVEGFYSLVKGGQIRIET